MKKVFTPIIFLVLSIFGGSANANGSYVNYDPFSLFPGSMANPTAKFTYRTESPNRPDTGVAVFESQEFNKFKNKLVSKVIYSIDSDLKKTSFRTLINFHNDSTLVPWFKFAFALTPLDYAVQVAQAVVDLGTSYLPEGIHREQGDLTTLIRLGGKVYLTETISGFPFVYSRIITYQVNAGTENVQVVLGMIRLPTDMD